MPGHTSTPIQIATSSGHLYQRPSNGCIHHCVPTKYTNWHLVDNFLGDGDCDDIIAAGDELYKWRKDDTV